MNIEERENFSRVLMELFKKEDITQMRFAELTGVSINRLYNHLHGLTFPNGEDFKRYCTYFNMTFDEFWELTHPQDAKYFRKVKR